MSEARCGDKVIVKVDGKPVSVCCVREADHPVIGVNSGKRTYDFHRGDGWVWDERCAWLLGEEPNAVPRKKQPRKK